ncbi:MAG TPA: family 43 glycosylhydrolase [Pedobacter sp.]|nr:family 43 glycosylhydrolase [Pedobacter sp.]
MPARFISALLFCMILSGGSVVDAQGQKTISVHDPAMIKQGQTYYVFSTGKGIRVWSSKDLKSWEEQQPVFSSGPDWAVRSIKGFKDVIWAPDIQFIDKKYYLYYCVSTFGRNTSAIGLATNKTLDEQSPDFKWEDHGMIIESESGKTNWNAIDPNVILDQDKNAWLTFGSFWDGIKFVKLNKDLSSISLQNLDKISTIASLRGAKNTSTDDEIRPNAIEAPFLFKKGNFYYLFASIGFCCRGSKSTYRMIVGRSKQVEGPYVDDQGIPMGHGGGKLILQGDSQWYGVGHNSACTFDGSDYLVFHGYDAMDNARPKLRIEKIKWKHGWPVVRKGKDN